MAILKPKSARRREVRRKFDRTNLIPFRRLITRQVGYALLYIAIFTLIGSTLAWRGRGRVHYREGQSISRPLVSRVSFDSIDKQATATKREEARDKVPSFYRFNQAYHNTLRDKLNAMVLFAADEKITSVDDIPTEKKKLLRLTDNRTLNRLKSYVVQGKTTDQWNQLVAACLIDLAGQAVLTSEQASYERSQTKSESITLLHPTDGQKQEFVVYSVNDWPGALSNNVASVASRFPGLQPIIKHLIISNPLPTYLYDQEETESRRDAAAQAVAVVRQKYQPNDVLVSVQIDEQTHKLRKITTSDLLLIGQEQNAYIKQVGNVLTWASKTAMVGLMGVLGVGLWFYFGSYNKRIMENPARGLAITALLCLTQAITLLATGWFGPESLMATGTLPVLIMAIVLAIAYNQRFAMAVAAVQAVVIALTLNQSMGFVILCLVGIVTALSQLRDVRTRSTLVTAGLITGLAMAICVLLIGFLDEPLHLPGVGMLLIRNSMLVLASGFAAGLFVQGILPAIERTFKVTTSMTLRELNDASHPLLRRLAGQAPGTYQHSLRIADLSEAAANEIGSHGLLCRVGAMYHDIGKMNKPNYFVENQGGGPNRHDKLSPAMSLLIIVGHVKDGIEMAREYRLPPVIVHFIESHHGTTLVEYFYHAAKKQVKAQGEVTDKSEPSEFEFRYTGPKPQTKEAAILMLCDGIEGAARTLAEPTHSRLELLVHTMASKRLTDGQFDQCHLTLQELHTIEQSITKTLCAIYHGRIAYPKDEQQATKEHPDDSNTPDTPNASNASDASKDQQVNNTKVAS